MKGSDVYLNITFIFVIFVLCIRALIILYLIICSVRIKFKYPDYSLMLSLMMLNIARFETKQHKQADTSIRSTLTVESIHQTAGGENLLFR